MGKTAPIYARRLDEILRDHRSFREEVVPLCAAETPISDFVRSFIADAIHERYAMGGPLAPAADNFIGARHVLDLHNLTIDLCREVFGACYADPRPLSGTSAVTNLLTALSEPGQKVLLQTSASGATHRCGLSAVASASRSSTSPTIMSASRSTPKPAESRPSGDRLRPLRALGHPLSAGPAGSWIC